MDYQPQSKAEHEIAFAMDVLYTAVDIMRKNRPDLPETAIGVALINLGIQAGLRSTDRASVVNYLHDAADLVADGFPQVRP